MRSPSPLPNPFLQLNNLAPASSVSNYFSAGLHLTPCTLLRLKSGLYPTRIANDTSLPAYETAAHSTTVRTV
ncbi:hypothetical protein M758_1G147300, partial [Ceratodon purpureus]